MARVRIVLVRTHYPGNLGSIARVMRNFGLSELVLVDPIADPASREARRLSTHGEAILERARIVPELGLAVADCARVLATSALVAGRLRTYVSGFPEQVLPGLLRAAAAAPVALVFGPEPSGLSNAEIARCHHLLHIPTDPAYTALNLAQAVTICLYELHRSAHSRQGALNQLPHRSAPFDHQERMFAALREGLTAIHFLYGPKADTLMASLRHLLGRSQLSAMEVNLLFGLARQLNWVAQQLPPKDASDAAR